MTAVGAIEVEKVGGAKRNPSPPTLLAKGIELGTARRGMCGLSLRLLRGLIRLVFFYNNFFGRHSLGLFLKVTPSVAVWPHASSILFSSAHHICGTQW